MKAHIRQWTKSIGASGVAMALWVWPGAPHRHSAKQSPRSAITPTTFQRPTRPTSTAALPTNDGNNQYIYVRNNAPKRSLHPGAVVRGPHVGRARSTIVPRSR